MMTLPRVASLLTGVGLNSLAFLATECLLAVPDARLAALQPTFRG